MRTKQYTLSGIDPDDDGLVTSAAPDAGVPFTLESGADALDPPREVTITSGGDSTGVTFTVVGLDRWGNSVTEEIVGPATDTARGNVVFSSITSITPDVSDSEQVEIGWSDRVTTPWVITALKTGADGHALSACMVSVLATEGAADGDVEVTYDFPGGYPNGVIRSDTPPEAPKADDSISVTPGTPVEARGIMARFALTSGTGTSALIRFARPG